MVKEKSDVRVSLVLLRELVASLEATVQSAEQLLADKADGTVNQYVVELSKAMGVAAGIASEATLLVGDMRTAIKQNTAPPGPKLDDLSDLLGALKGTGTGSN